MDTNKLFFLDETSFIAGMNRRYGWAKRGEEAVILGETRGKRLSIVGAMSADGPAAMMSFTGNLNTDVMLTFVEEHLAHVLPRGATLVMDGLSVHKTPRVIEALRKVGVSVLILPPYSPELNPIEHLWSTLKARIRSKGGAKWSHLATLVQEVWSAMDRVFFKNWVRRCGYGAST